MAYRQSHTIDLTVEREGVQHNTVAGSRFLSVGASSPVSKAEAVSELQEYINRLQKALDKAKAK